jgi:uroporphyrinogen-III decarboxylase
VTAATVASDLTPRERLFRFLDKEPIDRVPIWLLFPYHRCSYYADVRALTHYKPVFEASKNRAIMLDRRNFDIPMFTPDVQINETVVRDAGRDVTRKTYTYRGSSIWEDRVKGVRIKPLIDSDEDLQIICDFPVLTDRTAVRACMDDQLDQYFAERDEFPLKYGSMMLDLGEPINFLYANANLENYSVWSLTHADHVEKLLDASFPRSEEIYRYALERQLADVFFMVGSELAAPPMVSHATFERWVVRYTKRLNAMIRDAGRYVIQHFHGQIAGLLPGFVEMGPHALHTIEEPPIGNTTLEDAFATVGDKIGLIGCIQYDCFRSYSADEMTEAVKDQLERMRGNRFILSPSAGPYEENPGPQVLKNYLAFIEAGWEYGKV